MSYKREQGTSLIIALILLGAISLVGIATMQSSTLQVRMAGNEQESLLAQNAAESGLREVEQWLLENANSRSRLLDHFISSPEPGFYTDRDLPQLIPAAARPLTDALSDISDDDVWLADESLSMEIAGLNDEWARQPRAVVELLGQYRLGEGSVVGSSGFNLDGGADPNFNNSWVFRITAIGWSRNEDIYSVLQSTFITGRQFEN